jgi:aldose 1-epimerase
MPNEAYQGEYQGEKAVWIRYGKYEASVLPDWGANLIAFRDTKAGFRFLREPAPEEMDAFRSRPIVHGIPVLFPPNRYEDGKFKWEGRTYQFPVNEPSTGNHLHGFLHNTPWEVEGFGSDAGESWVKLSLTVGENHDMYRYFPHRFTIRLRYALSDNGLQQQVFVRNEGESRMPCLLAFHTAVNAPFAPGSAPSDHRFRLTIGERWELTADRMLPTGRKLPLTPGEIKMQEGEQSPFYEAMDNHYTAAPQGGRNRMELTDTRLGVTLVYDAGTSYKMWMIWNDGAKGGYFCPEPQVNLVNAPNVDLPAEEIGLFGLEPGEIWEETSRLYVIGG